MTNVPGTLLVIIARLPLRSAIGWSRMSSRWVSVSVADDSELMVWTTAPTLTDCASPASSSCTCTDVTVFEITSISRSAGPNPSALTDTVYGPKGATNCASPCELLRAAWDQAVPRLLTTTLAPAIARFWGSRTTTRTVPNTCASAGAASSRTADITRFVQPGRRMT